MAGFRSTFPIPSLTHSWFPGHMAKGLRDMAKKIQKCDCVIEVDFTLHHLKIPLSGRNPRFASLMRRKPRILLLNKMDLSDPGKIQDAIKLLNLIGEKHVIPVDCRKQHCSNVRTIIPTIQQCLSDIGHKPSDASNTPDDAISTPDVAIKVMIMGLPNVGKSSLINALRRQHFGKGKATPVGTLPGMTRAVLTQITVCKDPLVYLVDTPGVMEPFVEDPEVTMKLALTGTIKDHLIGEDLIADYALFILNRNALFKYVDLYSLPEPSDNIGNVLLHVARRLNARAPGGRPDYLRAAQHFVKTFRSGKMGQVTLDDVSSLKSDDLHNSIRRDSSGMSDSLASKMKKFP